MGDEDLLILASDRVGAINSASRDVESDSLLIFSTNCCLYSEINNSIFFDFILLSAIPNNGNYSTYQISIKLLDIALLIVISWSFP